MINFFKGNVKLIDVWYYIQGNVRYKLFYSKKFSFLIRRHIREQINFRIIVMRKECYDNGECVICGCATTALQMCDKACEGSCYFSMLSSDEWRLFKYFDRCYSDGFMWKFKNNKLKKYVV
jgi:hypothetical protein